MFGRRHRRHFFPFWIFFALFFFGFFGKSGAWAFLFPFFLIWLFGSMAWGLSSGARNWDEQRKRRDEWMESRIPRHWQAPAQPQSAPRDPLSRDPLPRANVTPLGQPLRSLAGLAPTCPACGGPTNQTTVEWHNSQPYCGYCGTQLK